ncbi:MAG: DinB family protein [Aliivibrio sp.]|uniref:DinB family protein n=1 Tax=Aliivibrio sp. TaxID=1872443 RepID=UPI001A58E196|nr:DinB family protein [Aliivibrio sp.]
MMTIINRNNELNLSVLANIEVIDQSIALLTLLTEQQYVYKALPYLESSIGEHTRHNIDLYIALMSQRDSGVVDYDVRHRGSSVEIDSEQAITQFEKIKRWLLDLDKHTIESNTAVKTEVSINQKRCAILQSTIERELIFVSSHTTHHLALMKVAAICCEATIDMNMGYAPATTTYQRESR